MRKLLRPGLPAVLLAFIMAMTACSPAAIATPTAKPAGAATAAPATNPTAKPSSSGPSEADRVAALIEGAKKEGKLLVYASESDKEFQEFTKPFRTKYPFIEVESWRGAGEDIAQRWLAEASAGRHVVDIIGTGVGDNYVTYKDAGLMMKYDYPMMKDLPANLRDPESLAMVHQIMMVAMAYNTNLVSAAEAPKRWEDLLDPKWKGQMAIDNDNSQILTLLWMAWGKEKAVDFLTKLRANEPLLKKGHTAMTEMLAAGEFKVAVELFLYRVLDFQKKKAPIEWVRTDPMLGRITFATIPAKAPHPNAAKLYMDWWGSEEGQLHYEATHGNMSPRGKLFADTTKGLNVMLAGTEIRPLLEESDQIYRKIMQVRS